MCCLETAFSLACEMEAWHVPAYNHYWECACKSYLTLCLCVRQLLLRLGVAHHHVRPCYSLVYVT